MNRAAGQEQWKLQPILVRQPVAFCVGGLRQCSATGISGWLSRRVTCRIRTGCTSHTDVDRISRKENRNHDISRSEVRAIAEHV